MGALLAGAFMLFYASKSDTGVCSLIPANASSKSSPPESHSCIRESFRERVFSVRSALLDLDDEYDSAAARPKNFKSFILQLLAHFTKKADRNSTFFSDVHPWRSRRE